MSEAAERAGVNVQTIRYYERRGLLPSPTRRTSGYREFSLDTVRRIRFIKRAQDLGFSLDDIAELLRLRRDKVRNRSRVCAVAERRLREVQDKMATLGALQQALQILIHRCRFGGALACPIIEALEAPPEVSRGQGPGEGLSASSRLGDSGHAPSRTTTLDQEAGATNEDGL